MTPILLPRSGTARPRVRSAPPGVSPGAGCHRGHLRLRGDEAGCQEARRPAPASIWEGFSRGPRPLRPILAASPRQRSRCKKSLRCPPRGCHEKRAFLAFFFLFFPGVFGLVIHFSPPPTPFPTRRERALEVPTLTSARAEPATACGRPLRLYLWASLIDLINQPVLVQRCGAARPRAAAPGCSVGAALAAIPSPCRVPAENGKMGKM